MANLLGAVFAILISVLGIPEFIQYEHAAIDNAKSATVASQLKQISDATQQYVQANAAAIESVATSASPATITVAMLQATGYLSTSVSAQNPYGQTWQAQALQPVAGQLQVIVEATGGASIPALDLPKIAALAGQQGGFVPYANQYGASTCSIAGTPCMMGSYGGWQVSMAHYTNPGSGYVGTLLYFNNGTLTNNYLYRNAVPGNPALNTMTTPLIMGATATAGTACSPTGAIAQDGTGALLSCPTSGNWAPVGGGSWKSPVANYAALPTTGNTLGDVRLTTDVNRAYAWNGTSWAALAVDQNGYLQIPGIATVGAACSTNGLIAQDGTGLILSCQSGSWAKAAGSSGGTGMSGILSPLKNKTISCVDPITDKYGTIYGYMYAWAMVDSNGNPYTRVASPEGDTGWVSGFSAGFSSVYAVVGNYIWEASWTFDQYPSLSAYYGPANKYCYADWPAT